MNERRGSKLCVLFSRWRTSRKRLAHDAQLYRDLAHQSGGNRCSDVNNSHILTVYGKHFLWVHCSSKIPQKKVKILFCLIFKIWIQKLGMVITCKCHFAFWYLVGGFIARAMAPPLTMYNTRVDSGTFCVHTVYNYMSCSEQRASGSDCTIRCESHLCQSWAMANGKRHRRHIAIMSLSTCGTVIERRYNRKLTLILYLDSKKFIFWGTTSNI